jgi:hypothetical protein
MIKQLKLLMFFMTIFSSTTSHAHTGYHNEIFHASGGAEHLIIILALSLASGIVLYFMRK